MRNKLLALLVHLAIAAGVSAQTVNVASLGSLELVFESATKLDVYPGQSVAAEVGFRKGEAFTVSSPGRVRQIEYLVESGALVNRGQAFAVLRGPGMHHFEMSYHSSRELLAGAERRFNSNKPLYERRAISESQWLEISEKYYLALLEYEHMRHFSELLIEADNGVEGLTLGAPVAGIIDYSSAYDGVEEGENIALFIPREGIRLEASVPVAMRNKLASLRTDGCELGVERASAVASGFFVQVWTEPLVSACRLLPGQRVLATPMLRGEAYRVPKSAVFQLGHQTHVLVHKGDTLAAVEVTLLGLEGKDYLLSAVVPLQDRDILITSVSAVQGVLLGLGGE